MTSSNPLIESGALRQLKHNDGSEGFVLAYDKDIVDRFVLGVLWEMLTDEQKAKAGKL